MSLFNAQAEFERFWATYPRKVSKQSAARAWKKLNPDEELIVMMRAALAWQIPQWDDPKYIPHASTWLNQRRWEDQPVTPKPVLNTFSGYQPWLCPHTPRCPHRAACAVVAARPENRA